MNFILNNNYITYIIVHVFVCAAEKPTNQSNYHIRSRREDTSQKYIYCLYKMINNRR